MSNEALEGVHEEAAMQSRVDGLKKIKAENPQGFNDSLNAAALGKLGETIDSDLPAWEKNIVAAADKDKMIRQMIINGHIGTINQGTGMVDVNSTNQDAAEMATLVFGPDWQVQGMQEAGKKQMMNDSDPNKPGFPEIVSTIDGVQHVVSVKKTGPDVEAVRYSVRMPVEQVIQMVKSRIGAQSPA